MIKSAIGGNRVKLARLEFNASLMPYMSMTDKQKEVSASISCGSCFFVSTCYIKLLGVWIAL